MAVADSVFKSVQCFQLMMESFDESLSQLLKDNSIDSVLDLWKNLKEYYRDLHKALQSRYEALKIKEEKPEEPATRGENEENKTSKVTGSSPASSSVSKVLSSIEVRPEIKILCDKADGHGLRNYVGDNIKEFKTLRDELSVALSKAPDAANLVIKALEGYALSSYNSTLVNANRRACILLLQCLFPVFGNDDSGVVPSDVKNSAQEIAKVWQSKLILNEKQWFNIRAFLWLLASFRIAADYKKDKLLRLVSIIFSNDETPELCRSLGLSSEVPDLINKLPKGVRPFKAIRFAHVCGIMDKVDPVGLMTSYMRNVDKDAEQLLTNGHGLVDSQLQSNTKKLGVLQNVIHLVKEYGWQSNFFGDNWEKKLREFKQERDDLKKSMKKICKEKSAAEKEAQKKEDGKKAAEKKAQKKDGKENLEKKIDELKKAIYESYKEKLAAKKKARKKEDGKKDAEKKADKKEYGKNNLEKQIQALKQAIKESRMEKLAAKKGARKKEDKKKAAEKEAQEKENGKKAAEMKALEKDVGKNASEKKAHRKEDGKQAADKKAPEKEDEKKAAEKNRQHKRHQSFEPDYGSSEKENYTSKRAAKKNRQHKRRLSFEPGCGTPEIENYASKRTKYASLNNPTGVAGGMCNSKASPYNIYGVQSKSGMIGHDHYTSAFSAPNRSSTGFAAGAFSSAPSTAAQINDERRCNPSAFGISNLTPFGSSLYGSSVPAGAFAVPMSNVGEFDHEGRSQQRYPMNFGEDKNHVRTSVYGTGDLAKSSATQINYNYEGRGQQSYKFNPGKVDNNPVSASAYGIGILENSSATQSHYERRGRELYTSPFGGGNTSSIGSSIGSFVYGSNSRTIPSSAMNQGGHERSLGQYSGLAGRNMISIESSGYGPGVSTVPPSNVTQGHFESRGSAIDRYQFNSGLTSLPPAY